MCFVFCENKNGATERQKSRRRKTNTGGNSQRNEFNAKNTPSRKIPSRNTFNNNQWRPTYITAPSPKNSNNNVTERQSHGKKKREAYANLSSENKPQKLIPHQFHSGYTRRGASKADLSRVTQVLNLCHVPQVGHGV